MNNIHSRPIEIDLAIKVNTTINGDLIEQTVETGSGILHRRVLCTAEKQTRDALISLGWTPPKEA